ncbi:MAG TPA: alanine racemase [Pseudidiomarina sp.]|nr:alanine racemase [Pseudidiomarina sp.]
MLLTDIRTPYLLLDRARMMRNIQRLQQRMDELGVTLRPHVKTAKSAPIAELMCKHPFGPITVSTLREAEYFSELGYKDISYAVGISPDKLEPLAALVQSGTRMTVLLDSQAQAQAVLRANATLNIGIRAAIELDCDGHRAGLVPSDPEILVIARQLHEGNALAGVLLHAGGSYHCETAAGKAAAAEAERQAAVSTAAAIRAQGMQVSMVSVGSTPTALYAQNLAGVTEVRAGVFVFQDLVMAGIDVCALNDIAMGVVATVIGHRPDKGWILIDAGWMALSRDRGTARQAVDQGYGVVTDLDGEIYSDLIVANTSQEHGVMMLRAGSKAELPELPIGAKVCILPNHACATASQFDEYVVTDDRRTQATKWSRIRGW